MSLTRERAAAVGQETHGIPKTASIAYDSRWNTPNN